MNEINQNFHNFDLSTFKKAHSDMIATSDAAYTGVFGNYSRVVTKDYTVEEVKKILTAGTLSQQLKLSNDYFNKDGYYQSLILYYATLLKYIGILIPNPSLGKNLSTSHIQKRYHQAMAFIDKMNLQTILPEWARRILVNGCYYGVILKSDKEGFSVLDLPIAYCRTRFKDYLGNDIIEFDLSYFYTITDLTERNKALAAYPKVISKAFEKYDKRKVKDKWIIIPADVGICFPMFNNRPLFLSVIPSTIQYEQAVETEQERDSEEIRKIIVQKIPHLNDGRLLFEPDEAVEMHRGTVGMVRNNKNTSVITTYADVDAITSKSSTENSHTTLEKMQQNIYSQAGVSSEIFAASGGNTTETSIKYDTAIMMYIANKFANFVTNLVNTKFANGNIDFKYSILPITHQNEAKYIDSSYKLASAGFSLIIPALAQGLSQRDLVNVKDLENDVLNLTEKLIPPKTAFTQGGEEEAGRPTKEAGEKRDQTLRNEESVETSKTQGGSE